MIGRRRTLSRGHAALGACWIGALLVTAPPALAQQSDFSLRLLPGTPATSAALKLHIVYRNPADPNGKPSPIRRLVIVAPHGTGINVSSVPRCGASNQQLQAEGPSGCPPDSKVGSGTLTAITGFGPPVDPFTGNVTIFNDGSGWIEVVQDQHSGATVALDRIQANGNTLTGTPPATPGGPPDGQTAVRTIDFTFPASTGYITTPRTCPSAGAWGSTATFTFADGSTQNVSDTTGCRAAASEGPRDVGGRRPSRRRAPRVRLTASPWHVHTGWRTIRFLVRSAVARCRNGATIRFARHRARTDSHGRTAMRIHLTHSGTYFATASKSGCRRATTTIMAVRDVDPRFAG